MSEQITKQVLEIPFEEYKNASHPEIFFWLQVVPFESFPRFDSFLEFIIRKFNFIHSNGYFPEHFSLPENIPQPFHDHSINFNSWLAIHPCFPAAITFFEHSKNHTELHHFKKIISLILCHFIGVQSQLRSEYLTDPNNRNFSNTLIQSSRIMRLHLTQALEAFSRELSGIVEQTNIPSDQILGLSIDDLLCQANDSQSLELSNNIEDKIRRFKKVISCISNNEQLTGVVQFIEQLDEFLQFKYDLKPLMRLFKYYIEDKHLGQKRSASRMRGNETLIYSNQNLNDMGAKVLNPPHTEHTFSSNNIGMDDVSLGIQEVIDMGEAPLEFENNPKVFSEDLLLEENIRSLPVTPIEKNLSINTRLSPSKGAGQREQIKSARNAVSHILKGKLKLIESWDALSLPEVSHLLDLIQQITFACSDKREAISDDLLCYMRLGRALEYNDLIEACTALLASLLLGCTIEDIYFVELADDLIQKDIGSKRVFSLSDGHIYYDANVPTYKKPLVEHSSVEFYAYGTRSFLLVPYLLGALIKKQLEERKRSTKLRKVFSAQVVELSQAMTQSLNRRYSTRLTLNRISNVLSYIVKRRYGDKSLLGLLGLNPSDVYVQNYYSNYSICEINNYYQSVLQGFCTQLDIENSNRYSWLSDFKKVNSEKRVGSRNRIKEDSLNALIKHNNSLVNTSGSLRHHEYHNLMTAYLFFLMMFFCGARPSKRVLSNVSFIDDINNLIFISDKDSVDSYSTRPVPVHKTLIQQIQAYQKHLRIYQITHLGVDDNSFLYFLDNKNTVKDFEIKKVFEYLKLPTSLPKNLLRANFRHLMLDMFFSYGQDADLMLSHWDAGEEFFANYSCYDFTKTKHQYEFFWSQYEDNGHELPITMECRL